LPNAAFYDSQNYREKLRAQRKKLLNQVAMVDSQLHETPKQVKERRKKTKKDG